MQCNVTSFIGGVSYEVERLPEEHSSLVQVYHTHVEPRPEHEGRHASREGALGVSQVKAAVKQRLDSKQSGHSEIVKMFKRI